MNKLTQKIAAGAAALASIASLAVISTSVASAATTTGTNTTSQEQTMHRGNFQMGRGFKGTEMFDKNITRTVANITNGVTETLTSTDAATVTRLQARQVPTPPADSKITVTQTNVTNGIQITTTSTDAATVTRLQDEAKNGRGPGMGGPRGHGRMGMEGIFDANVKRSVQKITDGVTITLTSTDAATVTRLQQLAGN